MRCTNAKHCRRSQCAGFTLVELMLASIITAFIFIGVFSAYLYLGRGTTRSTYFQKQNVESGRLLIQFARDISAAEKIGGTPDPTTPLDPVGSPTSTTLALKLAVWESGIAHLNVTYSFTTTGSDPVIYQLVRRDSEGRAFTFFSISRRPSQTPPTFAFIYYTKAGVVATDVSAIRSVEYSLGMVDGDATNGTQSTYFIVSPRMSLRNKPPFGQ